jgi:hypothetical protein
VVWKSGFTVNGFNSGGKEKLRGRTSFEIEFFPFLWLAALDARLAQW